eukprot:8997797-Lingulodinium_polyedra.AAC.1
MVPSAAPTAAPDPGNRDMASEAEPKPPPLATLAMVLTMMATAIRITTATMTTASTTRAATVGMVATT